MHDCTILQSGTCELNSSEKRWKDELKWLPWSMKNSCKYDAEVQPQQKATTTEAMKCFCSHSFSFMRSGRSTVHENAHFYTQVHRQDKQTSALELFSKTNLEKVHFVSFRKLFILSTEMSVSCRSGGAVCRIQRIQQRWRHACWD